jgi:hypothetical protein
LRKKELKIKHLTFGFLAAAINEYVLFASRTSIMNHPLQSQSLTFSSFS